jgi:hypothetical protein
MKKGHARRVPCRDLTELLKRMLPPSANTKGCAKSHPRWRRAVPRLRFGQDDIRFELGGSKVRLADKQEGTE